MSDIEQSPDSIQAPLPKRKYTRKPKVVVQEAVIPIPSVEHVDLPVEIPTKAKRTYTRKPKLIVQEPLHVEPEPEPLHEEPIHKKPIHEELIKEIVRKPRTEKQIAAFNKMREARLKKSQELEDIKAFQKEKDLLEKEQAKIQKIEEKIVKKRQPKTPKQKVVHEESYNEHVTQVSTHRPILFV